MSRKKFGCLWYSNAQEVFCYHNVSRSEAINSIDGKIFWIDFVIIILRESQYKLVAQKPMNIFRSTWTNRFWQKRKAIRGTATLQSWWPFIYIFNFDFILCFQYYLNSLIWKILKNLGMFPLQQFLISTNLPDLPVTLMNWCKSYYFQ